jgi:hypothetical protein
MNLRKRIHIVALLLAVGLILVAEILKKAAHQREATICSMVAWALLLGAFLYWAWLGRGWRAALGELARVTLLTLVAGSVLYFYFARSESLDAGVHVDAVYSYVGLTWFTELRNPITFVAPNLSYVQLPLMELAHLPAVLIGFDRLGPFSFLFGTMLQVAILIAVMTIVFVPRRLALQIPIAALVAAVFSNRMLVLSYNNFGYSMPAICLGFMFMVVVDEESIPDPDRLFGGLLLVAILHHYSGLTQVLPLALLWLALRPRGPRRFPSFLATNPLLLGAAAMFLITLVINPQPFTVRLQDLTIGRNRGPVLPLIAHDLVAKMGRNWTFLVHSYPGSYYYQLFIGNGGSWTFLSIPPLGGLIGPLVVGAWILSAWSLGSRWWRYVAYFVLFVIALLVLAVAQHLLTDFMDYRDVTPIFALLVASLLFVFRLPRSGRFLRLVAICYAVGIAVFNYVDLAKLHGRTHSTEDYAYISQQTMEGLVAYLKRRPPQALGVSRIHVALDSFFPLQSFYMKELARYGVPIQVVDAKAFCGDRGKALEAASAAGCDAFLLVTHTNRCPRKEPTDGSPQSRVHGYLYRSICDHPGAGLGDRGEVTIGLDPDESATR